MAAPMRFMAVCCKASIPASTLNTFFTSTRDTRHPETLLLVLIRSQTDIYTDITTPPITLSITNSPFTDKTHLETREILRLMRDKGSELNYNWFVVLDERSIKDETVELAGWNGEEGVVETVRASFEVANTAITAHCAGVGAISEDREIAGRTEDGVLR